MSAYREPGGQVDLTDIERAKIHEAAETKRKAIEEREKTRRLSIENRDTSGYILPRIVAGLLAGGVVIAATVVGNAWIEARHAPACVESAEVINSSTTRRDCRGGWLDTEPVKDGTVLVRCRCSAPVAHAPKPAVSQ